MVFEVGQIRRDLSAIDRLVVIKKRFVEDAFGIDDTVVNHYSWICEDIKTGEEICLLPNHLGDEYCEMEAIAWAAKIPSATGGSIEVRPIMEFH